MRFAIINESNLVVAVYEDTERLRQAYEDEAEPSDRVQPIMTLDEFLKIHYDYRGFTSGRPSVMYMEPMGGGTVYGSVYLIESWETFIPWTGKRYADYVMG